MSTKLKIHDESRIHSTLKTTNTNANENNSKRSVNNSWHSNMAKIVNSPNTTTDGTLKKEKQTASTATTVVSKQPSDRLASSISSTLLNIPSPPCTNNPTLKFSSHFDDFLNPYTQKSIQFEQYRLDDRSHMIFQFIALSFFIGLILLLMFYVLLRYPYTELTDGINAFFYITIGILFMLLIVKFVLHHQNSSNHDKMTKQLTEDPKFHDLSHSQDLLKANTLSAIWKYFGKLWSSADEQERILEYISYYLITASIQLYVMYQLVLKHHYHYKLDYLPGRGSLPEGMVAVGLFCTLCVYFVFKNVSFRLAVILETSVFLMDLVVLCHWQLLASLSRLLLGYIVAMFILSEYHRQVWRSFEAQKQLEAIMQENLLLAEEIKANELRHMIGNVAHDLKTPLSSFISGMEVIRTEAQELLEEEQDEEQSALMSGGHALLTGMKKKLSTILEVAENVMNTNAFMIMTINRCIDYNKTLFGLKLTPKTESFRLKDSVEFTVNCLKNNYEEISINCQYVKGVEDLLQQGEVIIKSDKQWLQENLLCLVGNAVKYSVKDSEVNVKIEVIEVASLEEMSASSKHGDSVDHNAPTSLPWRSFSISGNRLASKSNDSVSQYSAATTVASTMKMIGKSVSGLGSAHISHSGMNANANKRAALVVPLETSISVSKQDDQDDIEANMAQISFDRNPQRDIPRPLHPFRHPSQDKHHHRDSQLFLKFTITDHGPGIDATLGEKLFLEPAQAARLTGGTGLGLYSLARRVDTLGGQYGILKRPDEEHGSVIWFTIPFEAGNNSSPKISNRKILLADSNQPSINGVVETSLWATCSVGTSEPASFHLQHNGLRFDEESDHDDAKLRPCKVTILHNEVVCDTHRKPIHSCRVIDIESDLSCNSSFLLAQTAPTNKACAPVTSANASPTLIPPSNATVTTDHARSARPSSPTSSPSGPDWNSDSTIHKSDGQMVVSPSIMSPRQRMPVPKPIRPNMTVLVVDDSPVIVKMTSLSLSKHGYKVKTACNGEDAVELYREELRKLILKKSCMGTDVQNEQNPSNECDSTTLQPFDVILMDFQMPVMDGLASIYQIRKCEKEESLNIGGKRCVIVGFSAKSDESQIDQGFRYGMDAFLPKPFTINAFESILLSTAAQQAY